MSDVLVFPDGRRVEVTAELVLGREGDVLIEDEEASRRHAAVRPAEGDRIEVEDLGSRNGTFVNDERLGSKRVLAPRDTVRLGTTTFAVEGARSSETVISQPRRAETVSAPVTPAPTPAAALAPAAATPAAAAPPPFQPARVARRGSGPATRLLAPAALAYGAVIGTAAALIVYFAGR